MKKYVSAAIILALAGVIGVTALAAAPSPAEAPAPLSLEQQTAAPLPSEETAPQAHCREQGVCTEDRPCGRPDCGRCEAACDINNCAPHCSQAPACPDSHEDAGCAPCPSGRGDHCRKADSAPHCGTHHRGRHGGCR